MKHFLLISTLVLIFSSCKKKDNSPVPDTNTPTTTGVPTSTDSNYVNAYVLVYKNYNYSIVANDTLYNKSYY